MNVELHFQPTPFHAFALVMSLRLRHDTTLFHIRTKEKLFLSIPFQHENCYVDPIIHIKMNIFLKITTWMPLIPQFKHLHNLHNIQALNTNFLCQHYEDIYTMIITFKCRISYVLYKQKYTMHQ